MIRLAVISDTHGNTVALDAVLADLQRYPVDQVVCLGDMAQGGAQPAQIIERLRQLNAPVIMGNADQWLLNGIDTSANETTTPEQEAVRQWSLSQLSQADQAYIAAFLPTVEIKLEGGNSLLCFHGSPTSFDDVILPNTDEEMFQGYLNAFPQRFFCGGHTHTQQIRRFRNGFFFNPGSVGFAYSHQQPDEDFQADPWADYAVLTSDGDRVALDFRKVPFDVAAWVNATRASGRPNAQAAVAMYDKALGKE